jgi:hypothetical protein
MSATANSALLKIASIQMISTPDLQENLGTAGRLIRAAAQDGAQLVVLPEYFCMKVSARFYFIILITGFGKCLHTKILKKEKI